MHQVLAVLCLAAGAAAVWAAPSVIPQPVSIDATPSCRFTLDPRTSIAAPRGLEAAAAALRGDLAAPTGFRFPPASDGPRIEFLLDKTLPAEGYRIDARSKRVSIRAATPAGAFYAVQTLKQLLPPDVFRRAQASGVAWSIPCVRVEDRPRFAWRGALLDSGRHYLPKEFLFRFFDLMALYKLNVFHWHMTDDTGWRIEINRYPRLTGVASQMDLSLMNPSDATRAPSETPGGYHTQDDIREIVRYAAARHITIVPEIEMPGHAGAAIFAYPELGNKRQIEASGGDVKFMGDGDNVFNVDDATLAFLKNVLDEVLALFPSRFVHIGGDEVWKEPWKKNPKVQARMKALGLKSEEEMQSWFIKQMDAYLTSKGRRLVGWDEILEGGLAPNATVTSWRGLEGGIAAAKAGHDVVINPMQPTYLDYYQAKPDGLEPRTIGNVLALEEVYKFEPVPRELSAEEARHVLGGQASLWGEFMSSPKQVEYMAFPRLAAFAETVWSPKDARSIDGMLKRLAQHALAWDVLGINYRRLNTRAIQVGTWEHTVAPERGATKSWDVTAAIEDSGYYKVLFDSTGDRGRLKVDWVELLQDGRPLLKVEQPYQPGGGNSKDNLFVFVLQPMPGAVYVLRAGIREENETPSRGAVYVARIGNPARPRSSTAPPAPESAVPMLRRGPSAITGH
ncbi:MAG: beta-N-acetylhexosaminidase [Elusimicrobia bacterium]|nr:beta-N-acetylhexosaminidase [Elusimicrobiota bacterium]